jgi:hypothetical protein
MGWWSLRCRGRDGRDMAIFGMSGTPKIADLTPVG